MSFHSTPASTTAEKMASTPISIADLPSKRPNGCRPTPMMATSFMRQSSLDRFQGERDDFVAVVVSGERNHRQLDVHAELQLGRVLFGEPAFDTDDVLELNQPDAERHEVLTGWALVWRPWREALRRPCHESSAPRQQHLRHLADTALRAAGLGGKRRGAAAAAAAADQLWILVGPGRNLRRQRLLHDVILRGVRSEHIATVKLTVCPATVFNEDR